MSSSKTSTSQEHPSNNSSARHLHVVYAAPVDELQFNGSNGEIVSGGSNSCIKVGHFSNVQAMEDSFVSTGHHAMVIVGDYSDVFSGDNCNIIAGNDCSVTTGLSSSVCAGPGTVITFTDSLSSLRFCVGENGIVPCVSYRLCKGQLVPDMGLVG